ncbi:Uncharacterized protein Rs2_45854 [Raphanus sativus]|nr:Uncharacterized protein Rs2_45854 [Raphanus sativus]
MVVADDLQSERQTSLDCWCRKPGSDIWAKQIVSAGGPRQVAYETTKLEYIFLTRGGLVQVNYFPSRYDPVRHAENYPTPPAVCYVKRGGPARTSVDGLMLCHPLPSHMKSAASGYLAGPRLISHWDRSWQAV